MEALLEAGYAVMLLLVALGLERLAQLSHGRANQFHTAGFRYLAHLDAWECSAGEHLTFTGSDLARRLSHYRARASACNGCALKPECTDSDQGREVVRSLDVWPQSEIAHFHRGISVMLAVLAAVIAVVGLVRARTVADGLVLTAALLLTILLGHRLWVGFRAGSGSGLPGVDRAT